MIWTHVAAAILAAALAFWGGWNTQGWRLGEQIAHVKAAQAEQLASAQAAARAKEQVLNEANAKVNNDYLTEKARAAAAAGRAVAAGRLLSEALAAAAAADQNTAAACGTDDPRGAIASECAAALRSLDGYAGSLAAKTRALQDYAGRVCVTP